MFVRSKMGYVRPKIGLTGQFDRRQPGNYLQPWRLAVSDLIFWGNKFLLRMNYMSPVGLNVYFLFGKVGSTQSARALSVVYKNGSET